MVSRAAEVKAFDETKSGVKGLVDAGISSVPAIFIHPPATLSEPSISDALIPIIDLQNIKDDPNYRSEIIDKVRDASENWGFFQVLNHSISPSLLEDMLRCVRRFYDQDDGIKQQYYTRDVTKTFVYNSNFDLYSRTRAADWRDTFYTFIAPTPPKLDDLPEALGETFLEFSTQVMDLGFLLFELVSEALGLEQGHLKEMGCAEGMVAICHCYPSCPQPEIALGASKHADNDFLTVLLQDQLGGLQILHENHWVDVAPIAGALVVNVGDLLQLISNDKFKSVEHRVLANRAGPRISVACFFSTSLQAALRKYGPIKELLSEENPPKYRETTVQDYVFYSNNKAKLSSYNILHTKLLLTRSSKAMGSTSSEPSFDLDSELRAFDDTKSGVKGLVDSGITTIPRIFVHHQQNHQENKHRTTAKVPIIDLRGVVNHGIPEETLDKALASARSFFEQDDAIKKQYYTRDLSGKRITYQSNFDLLTRHRAADWRDSFLCMIAPNTVSEEEFPLPCREVLVEYGRQVIGVGKLIFGLISDGLGLGSERLSGLGCADGLAMI